MTVRLQTKNFVQAMSAHVVASIQLIDLSLSSTADTIQILSNDSTVSPEAIKQALMGVGRVSDANFWIMFMDAQGHGVEASNNLLISETSYADRPYFSVHVTNADFGLFVSEPIVGKVSKRRVFALSRRVTSKTGKFIGVVVASVDASVFATVFANALFQPTLSITMVHTDGKIIARVPKFEESFALNIAGASLFQHLGTAPTGTYESRSAVDGDTRIISYKTIEHLPLVVAVGMASKSWVEGLGDDFLILAMGLAVIIAVLFSSGNFALCSFRKLAESEGNQRRLNDELEIAKELLALLVRVDTLTGLPNRSYLYERLAEAIARARRSGTTVSCLYLDIDGFKQVNDTLGHAGGDELLKQFGARVKACMRQTDMLARLAGDEFVAVIEGMDQPEAAQLVAAKIMEAMQRPFILEGVDRLMTTSIGVAISDGQMEDPDSLLRKADTALYSAKREGKNLYRLFEHS